MTKRDFNKFKKCFKAEQKRLNLAQYTTTFKLVKIPDAWAFIEADAEGCIATVSVSSTAEWTDEMIRTTALHEALHLSLAGLREIALRRCINEDEWHNAEEAHVCVMERIIECA